MHNKQEKNNAKQNQGISKYAFGGTKYPKRGRKQVSSCIQDEPDLKTRDQMSEMLTSSFGTGLFNPTFTAQQLQVFPSLIGNYKNPVISLWEKHHQVILLLKTPGRTGFNAMICHSLTGWSLGSHGFSMLHVNPELQKSFSLNGSRSLWHHTYTPHYKVGCQAYRWFVNPSCRNQR